MDPLLRPVGRESTATYWRRRALLLVAVLLVLFVGSRACAGDGSGEAGALRRGTGISLAGPATAESTSTATPSDDSGGAVEPTGAPTDGGGTRQPTSEPSSGVVAGGGVVPGYCRDDKIGVAVRPTKSTFPPTQDATFRLNIVNIGAGPCRYEVGPRGWEATVESGSTRVWNSDDCAVTEASTLRTLQPDEPVAITIVWDRIRSKPGCPSGQPAAAAGMYTMIANAGNVAGPQASFVLAD